MGYQTTFPLEPISGRIGGFPNDIQVFLSQIITPDPRIPVGASFEVIETIEIFTTITDTKLIGTDFSWFEPRHYLGNFQMIGESGFFEGKTEDYGGLHFTQQTIERRTIVTLRLPTEGVIHEVGGVRLDNCNFVLDNFVGLFPPNIETIVGFKPFFDEDIMQGRLTTKPSQITDEIFPRKIRGVGLFLRPGVIGNKLIYTIDSTALFRSILPLSEPGTCRVAKPSCPVQFQAFLAEDPANRFVSVAAGEAYYNLAPPAITFDQYVFVCPTDPTQTFLWYHQNIVPPNCDIQQATYLANATIQGVGQVWQLTAAAAQARAGMELTQFPFEVAGAYGVYNLQTVPVPNCPPNTTAAIYSLNWRHVSPSGQTLTTGYI